MSGESRSLDYKLLFDPDSSKAKVDLVKNIVAIANSGGGRIVFGRSETEQPGVDSNITKALDSARVMDLVEKYVKPSSIELAHEITTISENRYLLTIQIKAVEFPAVMSRQGDWGNSRKDRPLFLSGDIWIRHGTKSERANFEDIRRWILRARNAERNAIFQRISSLVNLPEGYDFQIISSTGTPIDSPKTLVQSACRRRERDSDHLLSNSDLAWIFLQRENNRFTDEELALIIASGLRRGSTLYYWLMYLDHYPELMLKELDLALEASDRDKSDSARNIVELTAIYADQFVAKEIVTKLKNSRYAHFRTAGKEWINQEIVKEKFCNRLASARYEKRKLAECGIDELEDIASDLAEKFLQDRKSSTSRKLADINRMLWVTRSEYADFARKTLRLA